MAHVLSRGLSRQFLFLLIFAGLPMAAGADAAVSYDADEALALSQSAIGKQLGDLQFYDSFGRVVSLQDYAGKPVLVSMVFTSCHHICPTTTRNIADAVRAAQEVLDSDSFTVLTIGFDTANDTPQAMAGFAKKQSVDNMPDWHFLSGTEDAIAKLSATLGFQYFQAGGGFDHIVQLTLLDRDLTVYRQVYGIEFTLPALMEPLKQLVYRRPQAQTHFIGSLVDRVRLFCTVYNPSTGRYEIDNSLFIQIAVGFLVIVSAFIFLWRGARVQKQSRAD